METQWKRKTATFAAVFVVVISVIICREAGKSILDIYIMHQSDSVSAISDISSMLFDGEKLKDVCLFMIDVRNDELSKVMKQVKNLIDNKSSIKGHNRETILEAFIDANLAGRIHINAVHFEILLMNQIRAYDDLLGKPDWTHKNEPSQLITLEQSLIDNPAITVRLQSTKLKRTLIHPSNRYIYSPSNMDLFTVEQPQKFIDGRDFVPTIPDEERDRKIIKPFVFDKNFNKKEN